MSHTIKSTRALLEAQRHGSVKNSAFKFNDTYAIIYIRQSTKGLWEVVERIPELEHERLLARCTTEKEATEKAYKECFGIAIEIGEDLLSS